MINTAIRKNPVHNVDFNHTHTLLYYCVKCAASLQFHIPSINIDQEMINIYFGINRAFLSKKFLWRSTTVFISLYLTRWKSDWNENLFFKRGQHKSHWYNNKYKWTKTAITQHKNIWNINVKCDKSIQISKRRIQ